MKIQKDKISKKELSNKLKPIFERTHPIGNGIQKIYRFKNDYGASVVRFKLGISLFGNEYGSYTNNEEEWELAVLKFDGPGYNDFELCYNSGITSDVMGHLSDKEVEEILIKIKDLPKK